MNEQVVSERPGDEQRAASARIGAAGRLLREGKDDVPDGFARLLFGHVVPEDLVAYDARELAALARQTFAHLAVRKAGTPKLRFDPAGDEGDRLKTVSVIEVVNDDMPFLVDSVMLELTERGLAPRLVAHPILAVERDKAGRLKAPPAEAMGRKAGEARESLIHVHVARIDDAARRAEIVQGLEQVLEQVRLAVTDWRPMLARVGEIIKDLKNSPPPLPVDDIAEAIHFLEWLAADNFTILGVREYAFAGRG